MLHAGFERLGDLAGALLDLAGDRLGAAEPQVLEVREDLVQRRLGFAGDAAERALGVLGERRPALCSASLAVVVTASWACWRVCTMVWVAALVVWLTACMASAAARPIDCVASAELVLIELAKLLHARVERVGGRLGADLDLLGDVLGAADQQLLEAADAGVEVVGDLDGAGAERLVDLVDLGADALGRAWCRGC